MSSTSQTIKTTHLMLRPIVENDISNIYKGLSDPAIVKYYAVSYNSITETEEQMKWFKNLEETNTGIWWTIIDIKSNLFYGAIGLNNLSQIHKKAEIGFWLLPDYWGKGIMKSAIKLVCNYAFTDLNLHRIEALVETENENSKSILLKSDFSYEGTLVDCEIKNGNFISLAYYAKFH